MSAGDLTQILIPRVAAAAGRTSLSANTDPTQAHVIAWLNEGVKDVLRRLLPRRLDSGLWTSGRLDKLLKITASEEKTDGAASAGLAVISLPSSALSVAFYTLIKIGTISAYVSAREADLGELFDRVWGSPYAIDATSPLYTFADGKLYALPSTSTYAKYYYVKMPSTMVESSAEDFPLDDDLMPPVENYAISRMWMSKERNVDLGKLFLEFYEASMKLLVGGSSQKPVEMRI